MQASTASDFIKKLKLEFGFRTDRNTLIGNLMKFCEKNNIKNKFNVWY